MQSDHSSDLQCVQTAQNTFKHSSEQSTFIIKAYELINNPNHFEIIHWSKSGSTFIIQNIERFQRQLLPLYFRHNRYQSFVRQLNMYDFHKIRNGDYYCENKSQFRHDQFIQGNMKAIVQIKRKGFQGKINEKQNIKSKKIHKSAVKKILKKKKGSPLKNMKSNESKEQMIEDQNSFFNNLPISLSNIETHSKQNRKEIIQKIIVQVIHSYEGRSLKQLQKRNRINATIQLAQLVKDKWIEEFKKISSGEDILFMKETYSQVKEKLAEKDSLLQRELPKFLQVENRKNSEEKQMELDYLQIMQQEDAIIESIFKAEIRSTLICITSQTFLNHGLFQHKNDTLMGM